MDIKNEREVNESLVKEVDEVLSLTYHNKSDRPKMREHISFYEIKLY